MAIQFGYPSPSAYGYPGASPMPPYQAPIGGGGGGGGFDWGSLLMGLGVLGQGVGGYLGARNQSQVDAANLAMQMQRYADLTGRVDAMTQQGPNQFSEMIRNFLNPGVNPETGRSEGGMRDFSHISPFMADIGQIDLSSLFNVNAPNAQASGLLGNLNIGSPGSLAAPTIAAPQAIGGLPSVNVGQIAAPMIDVSGFGGSRGMNVGQDALFQMLRAPIGDFNDPKYTANLDRFASGDTRFDTSGLLDSLRPIDQRNLDEQLAALHGSAGSLGARFGTAMQEQERRLRGDFLDNTSARNAQIQQQAFEAAMGRATTALGLQGQREATLGGLGVQARGQNLGAASDLGSQLGSERIQTNQILAALAQANAANQLTAGQANASNQLAAGQSNLNAALQPALQTQALGTQVATQNAQNMMQGGQFNIENLIRTSLANQQTALAGGQTNADIINRIALANQQAQMQAGLANQGSSMQAMLANLGALNQGRQFNAQQQTGASQFNAAQDQAFNQFMLGAIGQQGGFQNAQNQYNLGLLGVLGGVPVPQQQPSPWPGYMSDMSQMLMLLPFLNQARG